MATLNSLTSLPAITDDTAFYAVLDPGGGDADYVGTWSQIVDYIKSKNTPVTDGNSYADDAAAASGGVSVGEWYELAEGNAYFMPAGLLKRRKA